MPGRSEALLTSDWLSPTLKLAKCFPTKLQDNFMDFCASDASLKPLTVARRKISKRTQELTHRFQAYNTTTIYQNNQQPTNQPTNQSLLESVVKLPEFHTKPNSAALNKTFKIYYEQETMSSLANIYSPFITLKPLNLLQYQPLPIWINILPFKLTMV